MLDFLDNQEPIEEFLKRHVKPYDPSTDDYDRPPFATDIKEGKNDPIYNAHSYHTKVPPRIIIPYILHYTKPGDLVLDLFCGSGMTGVAAQMCTNPPADLLEQFPELRDRVGPRACILNDLSPAACHIAYNHNTPADVAATRREFERIKGTVQDEFNWLYGTEHYEPAVGLYDPVNAEVASRLKNPPAIGSMHTLLGDEERNWELLTKAEVEARLGYPVTELPCDHECHELDLAKVEQWVCIPATIQYTIWSDVYRCEGFVTIQEPIGRVSTRGKNAGKPMVSKRRVARGCGKDIVLWDVAVDTRNASVASEFSCPHCAVTWTKTDIPRSAVVPVATSYELIGLKRQKRSAATLTTLRFSRRITAREMARIREIESKTIPYFCPQTQLDPKGPQYRRNALANRRITKVTDFYTPRNLRAIACLWAALQRVEDSRLRSFLQFVVTAIMHQGSRRNKWPTQSTTTGTLYIPSISIEQHFLGQVDRKLNVALTSIPTWNSSNTPVVMCGSATDLSPIPANSVDYIFTDPPFGSNIYYSEMNLMLEAWIGTTTDSTLEAVVHRKNDGGTKRLSDYAQLMQTAFREMFRVLKPARWATVEFNNSDGAVSEAIKQTIRTAGFEIVNMLLLDKDQKTFKQIKGAEGLEEVVDKDVVFNIYKHSAPGKEIQVQDQDLEQQIADIVRQHLQSLPERINAEPNKYSDDYRTTATINSLLMNTLIPIGVNVERLNLPFIERVCGRYFRKVGQRWYLRGEAIGNGTDVGLFQEEVQIQDEESAVIWLRQKLVSGPKTIGELKPLWMRATGLLPLEITQQFDLDALLRENFWKDTYTNRWREPTSEEREKMNDSRTLYVLHDAERFLSGVLKRQTGDLDRCEWIDVLFNACRAIEEKENEELPALRDFDTGKGYQMISQLFHGILKDHVPPDIFIRAEKQARVASSRLKDVGPEEKQEKKKSKNKIQQEFDW